MRVLIVEDDAPLRATLVRLCRAERYAVDEAGTAREARLRAREAEYDVIVLDRMLPDGDGRDVCRGLRSDGNTAPVIMLTALGEVAHRIEGLDAGADDYLAKPFHVGELLARMRALARRTAPEIAPVLRAGDLVLDPAAHRVTRGGEDVALSAREFALLEFLMRRRGAVIDRAAICEHVWDMRFDPRSNVVDAFVRLLRRKLDRPGEATHIRTVRGVGYALAEEDA